MNRREQNILYDVYNIYNNNEVNDTPELNLLHDILHPSKRVKIKIIIIPLLYIIV